MPLHRIGASVAKQIGQICQSWMKSNVMAPNQSWVTREHNRRRRTETHRESKERLITDADKSFKQASRVIFGFPLCSL